MKPAATRIANNTTPKSRATYKFVITNNYEETIKSRHFDKISVKTITINFSKIHLKFVKLIV